MPENDKKGLTVKIDAQLHAQVKEFVEANGLTMAEFVSRALDDELHPKMIQGENNMEKTKTLAFQVPVQLFEQIKEYLSRHNMTQKEFVIGLITTELERDMALRNEAAEEETEGEELDDEETEYEDEELDEAEEDEDMDESEDQSLGM